MNKKVFVILASVLFAICGYAQGGDLKQTVDEGVNKVQSYYNGGMYKEAFEKLRSIEGIIAASGKSQQEKATGYYKTARERFNMYMKMRRAASAQDHLNSMEVHANNSGDEALKNDYLYNKTIYHYTFGQNDKGNETFKVMAAKLTAQKEYKKVDEVYKTLIANGRRSGSANLVAQSYANYMAWKDSVSVIKHADEIKALKQQIADNEAAIADRDSSITSRTVIIVALGILAAVLAAALLLGAVILLRFIATTRKQKKTINLQKDNIALKAKFISNMSAQLDPTLHKLDPKQPEVKALMDFSQHIATLSRLESAEQEEIETEEVQVDSFCEGLAASIRENVKPGGAVKVNAPKMSIRMNKEYVSHILQHLLKNAAEYTPDGGHISLDFNRRGAHKNQFLVTNTGSVIPEEERDDLFKPFSKIHDLTKGDGLGLPICHQMAQNMKSDLYIDSEYVKGTRFVLDIIC